MNESVAAVVARFFNVPESVLTEGWVLPPERLHGSIARRILFAALKRQAGVELAGVWTATTYGELLGGGGTAKTEASTARPVSVPRGESGLAIGVDVEAVAELPWSGDPWKEAFYAENFTAAEVAYATRQTEPRVTLAGLWCVKEAVLKCGAEFAALRPAQIEVLHDEVGRPLVQIDGAASGLAVSISHTKEMAVAVVVRAPAREVAAPMAASAPALPPAAPSGGGAGWVAVALALVALGLAIVALLR